MSGMEISADDLKLFLQEAETLLESLDAHILRLEQEGPDAALVQEIFRVAHTLKGSSGMLGFERMTHLTHAMEDLLDRVRKGTLEVTAAIIDALLTSLDALKVLKDDLATGAESTIDVETIVLALRAAMDSPAATAPAEAAPTLTAVVRANPALAEQVRAACATGEPPVHVTVVISSQSEWAAVRCFQVLNELDHFGEVLASVPTQAEIEAERVGHQLEALLVPSGNADMAGIADALRTAVGEIDNVTTVPFDPDASAQAPVAAPAAAPPARADEPSPEMKADPIAAATHRVEALQSTVRVDVEQIDALMNMVGELVIDRTRVSQISRVLVEQFDNETVRSLSETANHIEKLIDEVHERMMQIRMLPVGLLFAKFPRLVRDLSRSLGKSMRLELDGEDTEIDRSVIEQIKDPLVHLIRNACDHGIEPPAERQAAGKAETSILRLSATQEQGQIVIALADDGRGINTGRVKAKAVERGLISAEKAERMSTAEAVDLIFAPGLTTASHTTELSGRGVGLDIVRRDIASLGGRIEVETAPGEGTIFRLRLPLTLATFRGLLVGCGRTTYAIPLSYVQETLRASAEQVYTVGGRPVLHLRTRDTVMPMVWLDEALSAGEAAGVASREEPYVVVVRASESRSDHPTAIAVDRLIDQQDIVVKSLSSFLGRTRGIAGASILGDGQVVLILDVPTLIKSSRQSEHAAAVEELATERIGS